MIVRLGVRHILLGLLDVVVTHLSSPHGTEHFVAAVQQDHLVFFFPAAKPPNLIEQ